MNNATYLFDALAVIFKEGKREGCLLSDADIDLMCLHFKEVNILWDEHFHQPERLIQQNMTQRLTKKLSWRPCRAIKFSDAPSRLKCTQCWGMCNSRWCIFMGDWGIRWKIGWSDCINWVCNSASVFEQCRTLRFVHFPREGKLLQHPSRFDCSSQGTRQREHE